MYFVYLFLFEEALPDTQKNQNKPSFFRILKQKIEASFKALQILNLH